MRHAAGLTRRALGPFLRKEDGAVTVEWVAIAAAVTVGAVALTWSVLSNLTPVADAIGSNLTDAVGTIAEPPE
jgi:Flp pilus assembly pilin Flp